MKDTEVIESLNNAWRALCERYDITRNEETRRALNLLREIINKADFEVKESNKKKQQISKEKQISIEEWIRWLNDYDK